jgi:hypothetical protein
MNAEPSPPPIPPVPAPEQPQRRSHVEIRILAILLVIAHPASGAILWALHVLDPFPGHPDMAGLTATSIGIVGIIVFYIFLYKLETSSNWTMRERIAWTIGHILSIILLFYMLIWIGFASPWRQLPLWGDYNLETMARSWVISVIVVGTITLLGGGFDLIRRYAMTRVHAR